jgi:uncharacterized cofD-like protein
VTAKQSPRVVALGGGRGLSATLRATVPWASVTAVVSTADDGGSTGRLRQSWDVPALGDVRRCVAALIDDDVVWGRVLERRFDAGELDGHAVGNLILLALTEELGDLQSACDEVARMAGVDLSRARVVPVTDDAVVLHGRTTSGRVVEGQVAVDEAPDLEEIWVAPTCTAASTVALEAIAAADLVVLGPGSLYSSVLAAAVVGDVRKALLDTSAPVVLVANLAVEDVDGEGCQVSDHLAVLGRHGIHPSVVLVHDAGLPIGRPDIEVVSADLTSSPGADHDPTALGQALQSLVRRPR